jgi:tetratricopeptide (TPR) repeat protein
MEDQWVVPLEETFWKPDGTRRPRQEAIKRFGARAVWLAELREAMAQEASKPMALRPLSVPKRIFISYRWQTDEQNEWVVRLAEALADRGYAVEFDRLAQREENPPTVPEMVARLVNCHIFLAVIDPGYIQRTGVGTEPQSILDGWVFDEHQIALRLSNQKLIQLVGLVREGDEVPEGFRQFQAGMLLDVREPDMLPQVLERYFSDPGPALASEVIEEAKRLLRASHMAASRGALAEAHRLAVQVTRIAPEIMDGYAQLARLAFDNGDPDGVLRAARQALTMDPNSREMLEMAAQCAYLKKEADLAIRFGVRLLKLDPRSVTGHYAVGNVLDDKGQVHAGLAHLEIARMESPDTSILHNDTGIVYRHLGEPRKALACFARGLEIAPSDMGLLINFAATALEAGDADLTRQALDNLRRYYPEHRSLSFIRGALEKWLSTGGPPPTLLPRLHEREHAGLIVCSSCVARIPLASQHSLLCAGCGAELIENQDNCDYCGSDGKVFPSPPQLQINILCPYCKSGKLDFVSPGDRH